jgi:hypothetical protein
MPFTEDLDVFLDDADFAVEALYNSTATVRVILDAAYMEIGGLAGTNPVAVGKATDFPAASAVGKTLVIDSVSYRRKTARWSRCSLSSSRWRTTCGGRFAMRW